jgi:hypothetical protein
LAERRRRGYLDRLLDTVPRERGSLARVPRQIPWGPAPVPVATAENRSPAGGVTTRSEPIESSMPAAADVSPLRHAHDRAVAAPSAESTPALRAMQPRTHPEIRTPAWSAAENRPSSQVANPPQAPGERASEATVTGPRLNPVSRRRPPAEDPAPPAAREQSPPLPTSAMKAFERLTVNSLHIPEPVRPAPVVADRRHDPAPVPTKASVPVTGASASTPARRSRVEADRGPSVHIGTVEITLTPPAVPVTPLAPVHRETPVATDSGPRPLARLSQPAIRYGLGQG